MVTTADDGKSAVPPSELLPGQVRAWRDRRGLSAQQLADRIAEIGGAMDRVAISKIENGNRSVKVDEWLQLAYALAVPPPLLLLPLGEVDDVAIIPTVRIPTALAWGWLVGEEPPVDSDRYAVRPALYEWQEAVAPLRLHQERRKAHRELNIAKSQLAGAEYEGEERQIRQARARYVATLKRLGKVIDIMAENGLRPPPERRSVAEDLRRYAAMKHPESIVEVDDPAEEPESPVTWVTVHHPKTKGEATVAESAVPILARSGWRPGPLPKKGQSNG